MKKILFILIYLFSASCASESIKSDATDAPIENKTIGWMHGNCLAIKNPSIKTPRQVTIVTLDQPHVIEVGMITKKTFSSEKCHPLLNERKEININNGYSFYLVDTKSPVNLAIGMLYITDTRGLYFSFCTTTEGIQFSIKDTKGVLWKGYYYLGYESEATCK